MWNVINFECRVLSTSLGRAKLFSEFQLKPIPGLFHRIPVDRGKNLGGSLDSLCGGRIPRFREASLVDYPRSFFTALKSLYTVHTEVKAYTFFITFWKWKGTTSCSVKSSGIRREETVKLITHLFYSLSCFIAHNARRANCTAFVSLFDAWVSPRWLDWHIHSGGHLHSIKTHPSLIWTHLCSLWMPPDFYLQGWRIQTVSQQYRTTWNKYVAPRFKGIICLVKCAKLDLRKLPWISAMLKLQSTHIKVQFLFNKDPTKKLARLKQ